MPTDTDKSLRFWRPLPREAADIICGGGAVADLPVHAHEALQVILPASRFVVGGGVGTDVTVGPGQAYVTAPLELTGAHSLDDTPCAMRVLLVGTDLLPRLAKELARLGCAEALGARRFVVDDATLFGELWSLIDELRGPLVALTCVDRLVACLAKLFATPATRRTHPAHSRMGQSSEGVERVCNHLRSHTTESISLDDLASVAGLSKFYLLRVFRRAHGVTPHAYQMQLRLAHAWRLIVDGRSLSRATYDAGFADQSHLTRRFAAAFGLPPARYARQLAVMPGAASADVFGSGLRVAPSSAA